MIDEATLAAKLYGGTDPATEQATDAAPAIGQAPASEPGANLYSKPEPIAPDIPDAVRELRQDPSRKLYDATDHPLIVARVAKDEALTSAERAAVTREVSNIVNDYELSNTEAAGVLQTLDRFKGAPTRCRGGCSNAQRSRRASKG